jgi:hypothetical protein
MTESSAAAKTTIDERLENIFTQLLGVYERQAQERQLLIKEKEELSKLVSMLVNQTKEIGQYEEGIRKRIQSSIKESAAEATKSIEHSIADNVIKKIDTSCAIIDALIQSYQNEKSKISIKIIAVSILCSVLTGLLSALIVLPKPTLPLTSEQMVYLQQGKALNNLWPKLSQVEKDRLKKLADNQE